MLKDGRLEFAVIWHHPLGVETARMESLHIHGVERTIGAETNVGEIERCWAHPGAAALAVALIRNVAMTVAAEPRALPIMSICITPFPQGQEVRVDQKRQRRAGVRVVWGARQASVDARLRLGRTRPLARGNLASRTSNSTRETWCAACGRYGMFPLG